jgi:PPM family protein phosphatase
MTAIPFTRSGPEDGGNFEHHWAGGYLEAHLLSDVGKKRAGNEDACALCAPEDPELARRRGHLFAVADGMGGVSGGGLASRIAVQTLLDDYYTNGGGAVPTSLRKAVEHANRTIFEEAEHHPQYYGMGTTVSAVLVLGDHAYIAQVGDSRVYLLRDGNTLWQLTHDHSLVAEQVRGGFLSEEEARTHSLRNLITRAVGTKEDVKVDLFWVKIERGDTIMICSDGLSGVVSDDEITKSLVVDSIQGAARVLVGRALQGGGPDNITVAVVRAVDTPPPTPLEEGAEEARLTRPGFLQRIRRLFS